MATDKEQLLAATDEERLLVASDEKWPLTATDAEQLQAYVERGVAVCVYGVARILED